MPSKKPIYVNGADIAKGPVVPIEMQQVNKIYKKPGPNLPKIVNDSDIVSQLESLNLNAESAGSKGSGNINNTDTAAAAIPQAPKKLLSLEAMVELRTKEYLIKNYKGNMKHQLSKEEERIILGRCREEAQMSRTAQVSENKARRQIEIKERAQQAAIKRRIVQEKNQKRLDRQRGIIDEESEISSDPSDEEESEDSSDYDKNGNIKDSGFFKKCSYDDFNKDYPTNANLFVYETYKELKPHPDTGLPQLAICFGQQANEEFGATLHQNRIPGQIEARKIAFSVPSISLPARIFYDGRFTMKDKSGELRFIPYCGMSEKLSHQLAEFIYLQMGESCWKHLGQGDINKGAWGMRNRGMIEYHKNILESEGVIVRGEEEVKKSKSSTTTTKTISNRNGKKISDADLKSKYTKLHSYTETRKNGDYEIDLYIQNSHTAAQVYKPINTSDRQDAGLSQKELSKIRDQISPYGFPQGMKSKLKNKSKSAWTTANKEEGREQNVLRQSQAFNLGDRDFHRKAVQTYYSLLTLPKGSLIVTRYLSSVGKDGRSGGKTGEIHCGTGEKMVCVHEITEHPEDEFVYGIKRKESLAKKFIGKDYKSVFEYPSEEGSNNKYKKYLYKSASDNKDRLLNLPLANDFDWHEKLCGGNGDEKSGLDIEEALGLSFALKNAKEVDDSDNNLSLIALPYRTTKVIGEVPWIAVAAFGCDENARARFPEDQGIPKILLNGDMHHIMESRILNYSVLSRNSFVRVGGAIGPIYRVEGSSKSVNQSPGQLALPDSIKLTACPDMKTNLKWIKEKKFKELFNTQSGLKSSYTIQKPKAQDGPKKVISDSDDFNLKIFDLGRKGQARHMQGPPIFLSRQESEFLRYTAEKFAPKQLENVMKIRAITEAREEKLEPFKKELEKAKANLVKAKEAANNSTKGTLKDKKFSIQRNKFQAERELAFQELRRDAMMLEIDRKMQEVYEKKSDGSTDNDKDNKLNIDDSDFKSIKKKNDLKKNKSNSDSNSKSLYDKIIANDNIGEHLFNTIFNSLLPDPEQLSNRSAKAAHAATKHFEASVSKSIELFLDGDDLANLRKHDKQFNKIEKFLEPGLTAEVGLGSRGLSGQEIGEEVNLIDSVTPSIGATKLYLDQIHEWYMREKEDNEMSLSGGNSKNKNLKKRKVVTASTVTPNKGKGSSGSDKTDNKTSESSDADKQLISHPITDLILDNDTLLMTYKPDMDKIYILLDNISMPKKIREAVSTEFETRFIMGVGQGGRFDRCEPELTPHTHNFVMVQRLLILAFKQIMSQSGMTCYCVTVKPGKHGLMNGPDKPQPWRPKKNETLGDTDPHTYTSNPKDPEFTSMQCSQDLNCLPHKDNGDNQRGINYQMVITPPAEYPGCIWKVGGLLCKRIRMEGGHVSLFPFANDSECTRLQKERRAYNRENKPETAASRMDNFAIGKKKAELEGKKVTKKSLNLKEGSKSSSGKVEKEVKKNNGKEDPSSSSYDPNSKKKRKEITGSSVKISPGVIANIADWHKKGEGKRIDDEWQRNLGQEVVADCHRKPIGFPAVEVWHKTQDWKFVGEKMISNKDQVSGEVQIEKLFEKYDFEPAQPVAKKIMDKGTYVVRRPKRYCITYYNVDCRSNNSKVREIDPKLLTHVLSLGLPYTRD